MNICWRTYPHQHEGNGRGLATASEGYKRALQIAGYTIVETPTHADIICHWTQPDFYVPVPGRINLYGCVCESLNLRPLFIEAFNHPDTTAIFTPSTFCQGIFQKHTQKPVFVAAHGIDHENYRYTPRSWEFGEPFVCLSVAAFNARKGVDFLLECWREMKLYTHPGMVLYLKVTLGEEERAAMTKEMTGWGETVFVGEEGIVMTEGNIIFDARPVTPDQLAQLYANAHCFLLPSRGEGFSLTLAEAMATGLPCIATRFSGYLDFCNDETAYLFTYKPGPFFGTNGQVFIGARPDPKEFCELLRRVTNEYPAALDVGRKAAERVAALTWERVGEQMRVMIESVVNDRQVMPTAAL